jgi:hypothetical protein
MGDITAQRRQESWFALLQLARPFIAQGGAGVSTKVQLFRRWSNCSEARPPVQQRYRPMLHRGAVPERRSTANA